MIPDQGEVGAPTDEYRLVAVEQTFRVNADATTSPIVLITAYSVKYAVTFSWFITLATFQTFGAATAAAVKTSEVNEVCGHPNVQAFRTEQDQDRSSLLYNYAVVTVGTDDQRITTTVTRRMDQINTPAMFAAIDQAWQQLVALGAEAAQPLA